MRRIAFTRTLLSAVLTTAFLAAAGTAAANESAWSRHHPRRDQVNDRLANQTRRIHREVKEGDLTTAQAQQLHQADRGIRQQERAMATQDNGHITGADRRSLNQQENAVSAQIGR